MNTNVSENVRVFKLSNGETVNPVDLEKQITDVCHYVKYVVVTGEGEDQPYALIFPDKKLLSSPEYAESPPEGCFYPRTIAELGKCLNGCLATVNNGLKTADSSHQLKCAAIVNVDLSDQIKGDNRQIIDKLKKMYAENISSNEEVYVIKLNNYK